MGRGNLFANVENQFKGAGKDKIISIARSSIAEVLKGIMQFDDQVKFYTMIAGAKIGIAGGTLSRKRKELIDIIFGGDDEMEVIYDMISERVTKEDYDIAYHIARMDSSMGLAYLYYILSFAYIDGSLKDAVAEKLEEIFAVNLAFEFMQSGMEEPAHTVNLTGLEAAIVEWLKKDDALLEIEDFQAHFSKYPKFKVEEAIKNLVDMGVLYCIKSSVGDLYGLE